MAVRKVSSPSLLKTRWVMERVLAVHFSQILTTSAAMAGPREQWMSDALDIRFLLSCKS